MHQTLNKQTDFSGTTKSSVTVAGGKSPCPCAPACNLAQELVPALVQLKLELQCGVGSGQNWSSPGCSLGASEPAGAKPARPMQSLQPAPCCPEPDDRGGGSFSEDVL